MAVAAISSPKGKLQQEACEPQGQPSTGRVTVVPLWSHYLRFGAWNIAALCMLHGFLGRQQDRRKTGPRALKGCFKKNIGATRRSHQSCSLFKVGGVETAQHKDAFLDQSQPFLGLRGAFLFPGNAQCVACAVFSEAAQGQKGASNQKQREA